MGEPELKRMTADEFLVWQQSQERNYELGGRLRRSAAEGDDGRHARA
jgi:hypothetical protein